MCVRARNEKSTVSSLLLRALARHHHSMAEFRSKSNRKSDRNLTEIQLRSDLTMTEIRLNCDCQRSDASGRNITEFQPQSGHGLTEI